MPEPNINLQEIYKDLEKEGVITPEIQSQYASIGHQPGDYTGPYRDEYMPNPGEEGAYLDPPSVEYDPWKDPNRNDAYVEKRMKSPGQKIPQTVPTFRPRPMGKDDGTGWVQYKKESDISTSSEPYLDARSGDWLPNEEVKELAAGETNKTIIDMNSRSSRDTGSTIEYHPVYKKGGGSYTDRKPHRQMKEQYRPHPHGSGEGGGRRGMGYMGETREPATRLGWTVRMRGGDMTGMGDFSTKRVPGGHGPRNSRGLRHMRQAPAKTSEGRKVRQKSIGGMLDMGVPIYDEEGNVLYYDKYANEDFDEETKKTWSPENVQKLAESDEARQRELKERMDALGINPRARWERVDALFK